MVNLTLKFDTNEVNNEVLNQRRKRMKRSDKNAATIAKCPCVDKSEILHVASAWSSVEHLLVIDELLPPFFADFDFLH